ncbi:MAG: DUF3576 domain-containing protein [Alphaproteobacteria bacterium]|nr:MAG: DUF3576 domain-containing protein [Alphaproteobacteria bacterium]
MEVVQNNKSGLRRTTTVAVLGTVVMLGLGGCGIFGGKDRSEVKREQLLASENISAIGINAYLWRASLETLDFMPMLQADPESGVIITDWYVDPAARTERAKVTVYILDKSLRADALKVSVFKQSLRDGQWVDNPGTLEAERQIEQAIMVQARRIRLSQLPRDD